MNFRTRAIHNLIANDSSRIIVVLGPTCSGKTALSIELAESLSLPIVNADSRLIYQDMCIGTAKPTEEELLKAKHHLIDIKRPDESYSASEYSQDFNALMNRESKVILVGGTGLYLKAALGSLDLSSYPPSPALRATLTQKTTEELKEILLSLDPNPGVDLNNPIRLIRAIEIVSQSGKPLRESLHKESDSRYSAIYLGLNFRDREKLYDLINKRVLTMIDLGLVQEVESLLSIYGKTQVLMSTIGYKEIIAHLEGDCSLDSAIGLIQQRTRNYAKRQLTWFRAQSNIHWFYNDEL